LAAAAQAALALAAGPSCLAEELELAGAESVAAAPRFPSRSFSASSRKELCSVGGARCGCGCGSIGCGRSCGRASRSCDCSSVRCGSRRDGTKTNVACSHTQGRPWRACRPRSVGQTLQRLLPVALQLAAHRTAETLSTLSLALGGLMKVALHSLFLSGECRFRTCTVTVQERLSPGNAFVILGAELLVRGPERPTSL
jgi:hypothetical protein